MIVIRLIKKFVCFQGTKNILPLLQELTSEPYAEVVQSSRHIILINVIYPFTSLARNIIFRVLFSNILNMHSL
jgi:hypothetical protein